MDQPREARLGWQLALPLLALVVLGLAATMAPLLAPYDPVRMEIASKLQPPSLAHWLGQDEFGRDILSRLIWGARASLTVALVSALIAGVAGVGIGLAAGYFRGLAELIGLRLTDVVLSVPPILLALLVVTIIGPGVATLVAALAILYAPGYARVVYGEVLTIRQLEYVEAARALGARPWRIVTGTILPNVLPAILVQFSLTVGSAIVIESGLSFLGLGVVPPTPSWGLMIRGARATLEQSWWPLLWPCAALVLTVLAVNRLCDALRDAFDPRLAGGRRQAVPPASRPAVAPGAAPDIAAPSLLDISGLDVRIAARGGEFAAVADVSLSIARGETVALVGESGSGKSMLGLSILGLVPKPAGRIHGGRIDFSGRDGRSRDLAALDELQLQRVRGNEIAMVFQEPMTAFNPVHTIGHQIAEALIRHRQLGRAAARAETQRLLAAVGIGDAARRMHAFPHQLSGGMRQRAMIAMALACEPLLLIADEPTTALDVTIQAEILDLLRRLAQDASRPLGMLFITHNLGIVAEQAQRVVVLYAGRVMEQGDVASVFRAPRHPYTIGLLRSVPGQALDAGGRSRRQRLVAIPGNVPDPLHLPAGCPFADRCEHADPSCRREMPPLVACSPEHLTRCLKWTELSSPAPVAAIRH